MDSRLEKNKAALKKLNLDRERFWAQTDAKTCSMADLIERFLQFTDSTLSEDVECASGSLRRFNLPAVVVC